MCPAKRITRPRQKTKKETEMAKETSFTDRAYKDIKGSFVGFSDRALRAAKKNLSESLEYFGPEGTMWQDNGGLGQPGAPMCALGAVTHFNGPGEKAARAALVAALPSENRRAHKAGKATYRASAVYSFNDYCRGFEFVVILFQSAQQKLERELLRRKKVSE